MNQKPLNLSATEGNEGKQPVTSSKPLGTGETHTPVLTPKLRVVLDAGHGGWDLGTVGRKGLLEKDLVLDIVERLGHLVESRLGAEVIYTRKDDSYLALEKRAEIANVAPSQPVRFRPRELQRLPLGSGRGDVLHEYLFIGKSEN